MLKLVLLRHGQSTWNHLNRFTGWTDVELSDAGIAEAGGAGRLLKAHGYRFDVAYTSLLKRAVKTLWLVLEEMDLMWIPVHQSWRLNERHYGALQGLNKKETAEKFGEKQVMLWRRSYDVAPPALDSADPRNPGRDARYAALASGEIPLTESLKDTVARFIPYWRDTIATQVSAGKSVIVAAHGNSLRALVKYLDDVADEDIVDVNIPTGVPLVYELNENLRPLRHYFLGDAETVASAAQAFTIKRKTAV